jgi:conjugal transfer pilus assembly protein TraD
MKELLKFEDPFRPIAERWAVAGWMGAGLGTLGYSATMPYPPLPFLAFAGFCGAMAATRSLPWMRLRKVRRAMDGSGLSFMTRADLKRLCDKKPDHLFLGYGFTWAQEEAQKAFTLGRYDPERLMPRLEGQMGQTWIHGLGVLKEEALFMPMPHAGTHTLIVGTTGAGKTRSFDSLIAQVIAKGYSVIIIDPKGDRDMCNAARQACIELGREEDFIYFHPAFPERSARIDPLKNFSRATELATRIASLIASESSSDPFVNFSQMALNKLCEAILFINSKPSLVLLRRLLEGGMSSLMLKVLETHFEKAKPSHNAAGEELATGWTAESRGYVAKATNKGGGSEEAMVEAYIQYYRDKIIASHPNSIVEGLISSFEHDASHFGKMVTSLMPVLTMLTSGAMGPLLSPDYDDPNDDRLITDLGRITRAGQVAYIGLDALSDSMVASAIGALLLSDTTAVAGARYNFGAGDGVDEENPPDLKPVALFVDEAAEVVNQPLIQVLNKGRGAGFFAFLATQTLSDFTTRLGSKDMTMKVLGNINNVLALRCNDELTQEYISELFGETVVRRMEVGQSSKNEINNPLTFSGTITERLSEEDVPLVGSKMLSALPNLEGFARVSAGRALKWRIPILRAAA